MRIGIIGLGYWGKIILRNLEKMGYNDITLCDISFSEDVLDKGYRTLNDFKELDCSKVFITTPSSTHFKIVKYFLENGVATFCEKPLTTSSSMAKELYDLSEKNKTILFTDWIFTFNSHINVIKSDYESGKLGEINSISMNRLNLGPERSDVNAKWDLASHDVSIIQYLFSKFPKKIKWTDYKRDKSSIQEDSCLGLIEYDNFSAIINASWKYRKKVRECVFEFDNYFVVWDDFKKFLQYEESKNINFPIYSGNLSYPCWSYEPPLENSINAFLSFEMKDVLKQKELTLNTIKILEGNL